MCSRLWYHQSQPQCLHKHSESFYLNVCSFFFLLSISSWWYLKEENLNDVLLGASSNSKEFVSTTITKANIWWFHCAIRLSSCFLFFFSTSFRFWFLFSICGACLKRVLDERCLPTAYREQQQQKMWRFLFGLKRIWSATGIGTFHPWNISCKTQTKRRKNNVGFVDLIGNFSVYSSYTLQSLALSTDHCVNTMASDDILWWFEAIERFTAATISHFALFILFTFTEI